MSCAGLTHILTHNRKNSCGADGAQLSKQRLFLHQTSPESVRKVQSASLTAAHNPEVAGSNPVPAIYNLICYAQIAQSVEQGTENPRVTGSIPVLGTV